jgi:hypothetical protein
MPVDGKLDRFVSAHSWTFALSGDADVDSPASDARLQRTMLNRLP